MKTTRLIFLAIGLAALMLACGKKEPTRSRATTIADLSGTWRATKIEATNKANNSQKFDFLAAADLEFTIIIQSNGRYTVVTTVSGSSTTSTGTMTVRGTNLIVDADDVDENLTMAFTLAGKTLTLTFDDEFDFDFDGNAELATFVYVLQKN